MRSNKTHKIRRRQVHRKQWGGLPAGQLRTAGEAFVKGAQAVARELTKEATKEATQAATQAAAQVAAQQAAAREAAAQRSSLQLPNFRGLPAPKPLNFGQQGVTTPNPLGFGQQGSTAPNPLGFGKQQLSIRGDIGSVSSAPAVAPASAASAQRNQNPFGAIVAAQAARYTPKEVAELKPAKLRDLAAEFGIVPDTKVRPLTARKDKYINDILDALARQDRLKNPDGSAIRRRAVAPNGSELPPRGLAGGNFAKRIGERAAGAEAGPDAVRAATEEFGELATETGEMLEETLPNPSMPLLRQLKQVAEVAPPRQVGEVPNVSPNGEVGLTEAEIRGILSSIVPGYDLGIKMRLGNQNKPIFHALYAGEGHPEQVDEFNEAMERVVRGAVRYMPRREAVLIGDVFTQARLSQLKPRLFVLFVRNPGQARQVLDLLVGTIIPRGGYNGALVDALIADLAANPESALQNLQRRAADFAVRALDVQGAAALARAKGFGWYSSRSLFTLLQAGFGAAALLALALAGINNADEFAARIGAARRRFNQNHPDVAAAARAVRDFYQRLAAAMGRGLAIAAGAVGVEVNIPEAPIAQSPPPRPAPVRPPPAEPAQAPDWVWAWADYLGGAVREARRVYRAIVPPMGGR